MNIYIGNCVRRIRRESSKVTRHRSLVGGEVFLYPAHIVLKIKKVSLGNISLYFIQYIFIYLFNTEPSATQLHVFEVTIYDPLAAPTSDLYNVYSLVLLSFC